MWIEKNLSSQWLIYINVKNVRKSIAKYESFDGKLIDGPRNIDDDDFPSHSRPCWILYRNIKFNTTSI